MKPSETDVIIVGSGPSAFASLAALPKDLSVTLVDVGNEPNDRTKLTVEDVASRVVMSGPSLETLELVFRNSFEIGSQIGDSKKFFGDDFSYDTMAYGFNYAVSARASTGSGGFSTVWGATVLPFSNLDLSRMSTVRRDALLSGYSAISELVRIEGNFEENNFYQNYVNSIKSFSVSPLSSKLITRNKMNSAIERGLNSYFHSSSVMVGSSTDARVRNCLNCGLCHVGCPFGLIWNSSNALDSLSHQNLLRVKGKVTSFTEHENFVTVKYLDDIGQKQLTSRLLILACGPISTAGVVLASKPEFESVLISDSQTYFKHCISLRKIGGLTYRNTLAEFMLAINTRHFTGLFAQLYSRSHYSDFRAKREFHIINKLPKFIVDALLSRIVTTLIYLPGERSNSIRVLRNGDVLTVATSARPILQLSNLVLWFKCWVSLLSKGLVALPFVGTKLETGGGNHIGNSRIESSGDLSPIVDPNGYLLGFSRVIVNDGSSLVRIPAGPVTFSIMATAFSTVKNLMQDHKSFSRIFNR